MMKSESTIDSGVKALDELVESVASLVSLPEIYLKIKDLLLDEGSDIDDFSEVILTDANLTSLVLKVANSAFYGFGGKINDIDRAVNLLGLTQLHDLVLALSAVNSIQGESELEALNIFWQRSIYSGVLARLLSDHCGVRDPSTLFVTGLLHEIGRVVLFLSYPDLSGENVERAKQEMRPLHEIEKEAYGYHYADVGAALLHSWNLPDKFCTPIEFHLDPLYDGDYSVQSRVIGLSHRIASNRFCGADTFGYDADSLELEISHEVMELVLTEAESMRRELEGLIMPHLT